jgi:hypothetical protein
MVRLAIVSTPRTGNTWLRYLLSRMYGVPETAVHNPADLDWDQLPPGVVVQIHWHHVEPLVGTLRDRRFVVVSSARHPLDVLVSILHFAPREPLTRRWLEGEGGNEAALTGADPQSDVFLRYAQSRRAAALLSVTPEWWADPAVLRVRYEDVVRDPVGQLERLVETIGVAPGAAMRDVIDSCRIEKLRPTCPNQHFWQGQPGLWRDLVLAGHARAIAEYHKEAFQALGYRCEPDRGLSEHAARQNWLHVS